LILDVGCGENPRGDVNLDLYPMETGHRAGDQSKLSRALKMKEIPNFIRADACHIPFKDDTFSTVFSSQTIEHVSDPILMIKEMFRVSKRKVIVLCPHRLTDKPKLRILHRHFFNMTWFVRVFKSLDVKTYKIRYSKYRCFPHVFVPIVRLPTEMEIVIYKRLG